MGVLPWWIFYEELNRLHYFCQCGNYNLFIIADFGGFHSSLYSAPITLILLSPHYHTYVSVKIALLCRDALQPKSYHKSYMLQSTHRH